MCFKWFHCSYLAAEEFRNIILAFFPGFLRCCTVGKASRLETLLMQLVFIYRAYLVPNSHFAQQDLGGLKDVCKAFCIRFRQLFGKKNQFYNLHLIAHLHETRIHKGPLTEYSAFPFEAFYGRVKRTQTPGTSSLGLQSVRGVNSGYFGRKQHTCSQRIHWSLNVSQ